jgi:hypothetical protein
MPEPQAPAQDQDQTAAGAPGGEYELFLSHATPDYPWVLKLAERLKALGLRVFLDCQDVGPGDNVVIRLSEALERSRYLALIVSRHTPERAWVKQE